jgi:rhodanese-related sulfurtransferase
MKRLPLILLSLLSTIATATTIVLHPAILKPLAKIGIPITEIPLLGDLVLAADLPKITAQQLKPQLDQNPTQILLIDVRTDDEFQTGHLPGAIHIPLNTIESGAALPQIRSQLGNKKLIAYCHSGRRSALAISQLQTSGITATHLIGGIVEWKKQIDPNIPIP